MNIIIIGIVFVKDCPYEPSLPISLIVLGASSIIYGVTIQIVRWKYIDFKKPNNGFATCAQLILIIATVVYIVALIWGNSS